MGVGLAAWGDELQIHGNVTTGHLELAFTDCWFIKQVADRKPPGGLDPTTAQVYCYSDHINIEIEDAYPGYNAWFGYEIENRGTLPAAFQASFKTSSEYLVPGTLQVKNTLTKGVLESGETATGEIHITVMGVEEEETYDFSLELEFKQWNLAD